MKIIQSLFLLVLSASFAFSQNYNLNATNSVVLNCGSGGNLFDSGGAGASYAANQNFAFTICTNGDPLSAEVVSVLMGAGDFLAVFDGTNTITAPLLFVFDENTSLAPGAFLRASAGNPSGCLTFQISSDAATQGDFEFILSCLPACQSIEADVLSANPGVGANQAGYIDLCPDDTLTITGTGIYNQNNLAYAQSDATSNFYWDFGVLGMDTGQTITLPITTPKIYAFTLMVEDVNGCRSINELTYKIRKAIEPDLATVVDDPILCLNETTTMYSQIFTQAIDSFITGDTIRLESNVSVTDTVFLPDDSDNNSGNGITTPVIYDLPISGYQAGAQMTAVNDLIEVCLDIEHSFVGDLDIVLVCPSGQSVPLVDFSPPGTPGNNLGNSAFVGQGVPFTYCWSPTATLGSIAVGQPSLGNDPILAGTYQAVGNWNNLIGCPLNGNWTIQIFDDYGGDDGWTFGASASFNPALLANIDSLVFVYSNPLWEMNNNITSSLSNDSVQLMMTDTSQTEFYFSVEDNLGCQYFDTASVVSDVYDVIATPDSSVICGGESVQLNATIDPDDDITCAIGYDVYDIAYYKETGVETPLTFTQADNGTSQIINLPFPFKLFCINQTQVRLSTNGYLQFGASALSLNNNTTMPANILPNDLIALMWDDLIDTLGTSSYFTTGVAPNRKFVVNVDFKHVGGTNASERVLGQIILHESVNYFDIICENCSNDASDPTATQGAENFTGFTGIATPGRNNTNWSATNSAYRYYPQTSLSTNYTTTWTPAAGLSGANTIAPLATPATTTTYIVDITSVNNCTYSDTIDVVVGGNFQHGISPDTTICAGDSVQLSVTGGAITVAWTPNDGSISDTSIANPIFSPTTTTTYTAALDSFSCVTLESVTIFVSDINVDTTIVNTETCLGLNDASIEIVSSGGVNPEYSIDGGANFVSTNVFQNLTAGIYDIVVSENNLCDTAYQITIIGGDPLTFDSLVLSDAPCGNSNDGIIAIYVTSGVAPLSYSIDNGVSFQDSLTFNNLAGGTYQVLVQDSFNCTIDSSVTISQAAPLVLSTTQVDSLSCFNISDGQISLSASGGTPGYEYSIDGVSFAANNVFSNLTDSTYQVYVRDANQCIDTLSVPVFAPSALVLTMDSSNISCNGLSDGNATVTVSGGTLPYTYLWNDALAQTNNVANGLTAGSYEVVVTDARGCLDTAGVNIVEPDSLLLVIDNVVDVLCNGAATGSVSVSTSGGTTPYSYLWTNGGGSNEDLSNAIAGSYTLTVTDANGCSFQVTQTLTQPTALNVGLVGTNVNCFGETTGAIDATINGGVAPYLFAWTGPNGYTAATEDISSLAAGTYTLVTTDANNCTNTQTLSITQPATVLINISVTDIACFGENTGSLTASVLSGGVAPYQFQWDAAANNQTGATASGLVAGSYTVTVTDANACVYSSTATVTQSQSPLSVVATGTDISCANANDGIALASAQGGTPGYTYLWNDPLAQTTSSATGLSTNVYQVTVTDANGCTATDTTFIDAPDPIVVVANPDSANCWGDATGAINIFASGGTGVGYTYSIDGGETFQNSPDFFNLPAGVYDQIIVQDIGSASVCESDIYTITVFEQPYFAFEIMPEDTTLELEESVDLSLNVTAPFYDNSSIVLVSWYPTTGLNCSDCIDPIVLTYESYTEYTATVSYEGGDGELCTAISNTIIIVENNLRLFIPNAFTPGSFDDMNNVFEVYGEGIEYVTMQVYNRWGEKIFESSNQKVAWDGTFKGEMQQPGVYTYYVNVEYLDGKAIDRKGSVSLIR